MLVRRRASATAVIAVALLAGLLALLPTTASAAPEDVFISELHYDDDGSVGGADSGEAVEVQGPVGESVDGWTIVLYNGSNSQTYAPLRTLAGVIPTEGVVVATYPSNGIQNGGPDGVALVDDDGTVQDFISYEGEITADGGPADGLTSVDIGVSETNSTPVGQSLQKIDDEWVGPATSSFGAVNEAEGPVDPGEPGTCTGTGITHTIAEVQGTGSETTIAPNTPVKVTGVVTADHRTGGLNGITIQTAGSGGAGHQVVATTASTGIFVYLGTEPAEFPDLAIGDEIEVTGPVTEFNTVTQITADDNADIGVCENVPAPAAPVVTPLPLPLAGADREAAESMLVEPTGTVTISDTFQSDRFGELILAAGTTPAPIPTDLFAPGTPEAIAQRTANANGRILLDDGRSTDLASAGQLPSYYGPTTPIRVGDQIADFGPVVLSFGFGQWRLQPTTPVLNETPAAERTTFANTNPRTPAPADVGGDITVGSFNVLNYFIHFGGEARGAANEAELELQEAKIVSAIVALDADVLALEEIENSVRFDGGAEPQAALERLVGALNDVEGADTWDYVESPADLPPPAQQDVITGAIIYKPASVALDGPSRSVNDETVWFNAREPIAQTFTANDATFTVVVNHFKSKSAGTPAPTGDNADAGDGQGAWNGDRVRQAEALVGFVDDLKVDTGSDEVLLFGDFNAYGQEDPMQVFYGADYTDLGTEYETGRESYVFGGEEGSLDHALASPELLDRVTGFEIWEINAHETYPNQYDADPAFYDPGPYRASDHNPELVGLDTTAEPEPLPGAVFVPIVPCRLLDTRTAGGPLANGASRTVEVTGRSSCVVPDDAVAVESSLTAVGPTGNGFARLWPTGATPPTATFLNFTRGKATTNTGAIALGEGGDVTLRNAGGPSNYVLDVQGYYVAQDLVPDEATGSVYVALEPCRITDTRTAGGPLANGASLPVQVTGGAGCVVPAAATGVEASVSVVGPQGNGYARVWPTGATPPTATFINYVGREATTNTGAIALSDSGSMTLRNVGGPSNYVIDVQGYFVDPAELPEGAVASTYEPIVPCRIADSRQDGGALGNGEEVSGPVTGDATDCSLAEGASALEVSVSAVSPQGGGYARLWPEGSPPPNATFLNYVRRQATTNTGSVSLSDEGGLTLRNVGGPSDFVVDVQGSWSPVDVPPADPQVDLQLLGINDFHGRLEPPTAGPPPVGGAALLAGLVDQLEAANPNTAFVSAGDNIGASTFVSAVDDDNPTLDALNAAGLDVSAVGNHEFDKGFDDLDGRVQDRAAFPYLGANVYFDAEAGGGRALEPYVIQSVGGVDVGYIGVVTEETPSLVSPDGISDLEFRDPVAEATTIADDLKDGDEGNGEADVVVLLAHEGAAESATTGAELLDDPAFGDFAAMTASVDAIVSGHTHQEYALLVPKPGGGSRPVVQTGDYGEKLGRITLTFDRETGAVSRPGAELLTVSGVPVNAEVQAIVDAAVANSAVLGAEVIGTTTTDILRDPNRATESVLANFIADVQLGATSDPGRGGAQIALMNPGGVRADIAAGEVTYSEAFAVQSFSNDVFTKSYTGAELKAVLEEQWQPAGSQRPVLALGVSEGFTFSFNRLASQGERIFDMELNGVPIDPAGTYRVTVNSFLASGGDNFTTLGGGTNPVTTGDNDLTMLVDHFRNNSPVTADPVPRTTEVNEVQLLGINDFHGRLEPPTAGPPPVGGAALLAGMVDQQRAENPLTAFVSSGDNIGASTFVSAVDDDNPTIDALNAAGLDVSAVGNHEFDKGYADLAGRVEDRADFPILGANVYFDAEAGGGRALDPYVVLDQGSVSIGYIGVVTEETPSLVSPDGISELEFRDPIPEVETIAAQLKDGVEGNGEADVVVLLAHEGAADPADLGAEAFGPFIDLPATVDVIFSGHTHQEYAELTPVPGGGTRPVVQTGDYGERLGKVTLTLDPATLAVTGSTAELLTVSGVPVNAEVQAIVADAVANSAVLGAEVIGSTTTDILRDPNRATESVLANFIADVQLGATSDPGRGGAQIALMNPGGVRADIAAGEVTYSEAFAVQSFSNDVFTKSYTGAELKAVLEEQWQPAGSQRPVLALGVSEGFTFSFDRSQPQGSRIIASSMELDGVTIDPAGTYRVTINSFLASGGDNFTTLGGGTNPTTPGDNDLTMLVDHFRDNSPVTADPVLRTTDLTPPP